MKKPKFSLRRQISVDSDNRAVPLNLLEYVTWGIFGTFALTVVAAYSSWSLIANAFGSGAVLNGTIISIAVIGVGRSIWSNLRLWATARYMHAIDLVKSRTEPLQEKEFNWFRSQLKTTGRLLDTKQMADLLENLPRMGHLNITDNDARMIKSKLGFRVSLMRANTGFLAGILVMLGLLGTFLGLLNTIDSIGVAMGSMSSIGDADPEAMSAFLASIAAPLKGMGLAFSSSLFGLSGSLLISFVNYLCGGVHDRFIENCSRWIDDRIPTPSQEARKAEADPKVASSDELKAWLAGFVQTATHTNRHIETLIGSIAEQLTAMQSVMRNNRALFALNKSNHDELKELRRGYARGLSVVRKEINDRAVELSRKLNASRNQGAAVEAIASTTGDTIQAAQARTVQESQEQLSMLVDELQTLLEEQQVVQEMRARHDDTLQGLPPTLRDSTPLQPNENPER